LKINKLGRYKDIHKVIHIRFYRVFNRYAIGRKINKWSNNNHNKNNNTRNNTNIFSAN